MKKKIKAMPNFRTLNPIDHWSLLTYGKRQRSLTVNQKKKIPDYVKAKAWDKMKKK